MRSLAYLSGGRLRSPGPKCSPILSPSLYAFPSWPATSGSANGAVARGLSSPDHGSANVPSPAVVVVPGPVVTSAAPAQGAAPKLVLGEAVPATAQALPESGLASLAQVPLTSGLQPAPQEAGAVGETAPALAAQQLPNGQNASKSSSSQASAMAVNSSTSPSPAAGAAAVTWSEAPTAASQAADTTNSSTNGTTAGSADAKATTSSAIPPSGQALPSASATQPASISAGQAGSSSQQSSDATVSSSSSSSTAGTSNSGGVPTSVPASAAPLDTQPDKPSSASTTITTITSSSDTSPATSTSSTSTSSSNSSKAGTTTFTNSEGKGPQAIVFPSTKTSSIDWKAKHRRLVVEELMAAARRAANKGRGGVRPSGKTVPLPYTEAQLEQGLMALEALLPGIQLNVNALPAAQYAEILLNPAATASRIITLKMAWPRANIATLVVKFPKVLLLSEAEIQANGVKVREMLANAQDPDFIIEKVPIMLNPLTCMSVLISIQKWYKGKDPVKVLEADTDIVDRAQDMDVPFEPVYVGEDGTYIAPGASKPAEKRLDWQKWIDKNYYGQKY